MRARSSVGLLVIILAVFADTAWASPRPGSCRHAGETVKSTPRARVLRVGYRVYGCLRATGRLYRVGSDDDYGTSAGGLTVSVPGFAGPYVAIAEECIEYGGGPFSTELRVVDLRSGHVKHRTRIGLTYCGFDGRSTYALDAALTPGGSIIWIAASLAQCNSNACTQDLGVFKLDGWGESALDRGPGVARHLTLHGLRAQWWRGDHRATYTLHDRPPT